MTASDISLGKLNRESRSDHPLEHARADNAWRCIFLRGGRVAKYKGLAGGVAPHAATPSLLSLASTSLIAIASLVSIPSLALAGDCTAGPASVCSGSANASDSTQVISGTAVNVTTEAGFGLSVGSGNAVTINGVNGAAFDDRNASAISGNAYGLEVGNTTSGDLVINANGHITGKEWDAISATNGVGTGDLVINVNHLDGGRRGIEARQYGTGALNVTSTGTINSVWDGVVAETEAQSTGGITINVNEIKAQGAGGNGSGIYTVDRGTGNISVTASGAVSSEQGYGIYALNTASAGGLTIDVADVSGGSDGIHVEANGAGDTKVTSSGTVTGAQYGMQIANANSGNLTITSTGQVTGVGWDAISATNGVGTGDLVINANNLDGGRRGIEARQYGSGALNVTSTGTINSVWDGVVAETEALSTGGITINVNEIKAQGAGGNGSGIYAVDRGTGNISVTASGAVSSEQGYGIYALNTASAGGLTIDVADVSGGSDGIHVEANGAGDTKVTSSGTVTGAQYGMQIANANSGNLTITSTGQVTGVGWDAISATNGVGTGDLVINANNLDGGRRGIEARQYGTGALNVTSTGTINSVWDGVVAETEALSTGGITINVNEIKAQGAGGNGAGIYTVNRGTGKLSITASGTVSSEQGDGIRADNYGAGLAIQANNVKGATYGIYVPVTGTGSVDVSVAGAAQGALDGVYVLANNGTKAINIDVNNAIGGRNAIAVGNGFGLNTTDDDIAITVRGKIQGGTGGWGIWADNREGTFTTITVKDGATVGSDGGNAIIHANGDSHVILENGATVNGVVSLGAGVDNMDVHGGFSGITLLDGGPGVDTLRLVNANTTYDGAKIQNWEVFKLDNSNLVVTGGNLTVGAPADATSGVFLVNGSTLDGTRDNFALSGNLSLAAGTTFLGAGTNSITGNVNNAGLISLTGGRAGDVLNIRGDYAGSGGAVHIDTVLGGDSSATDLVKISGNTSGSTNVVVTNVGGAGAPTVEGIKVIEVAGNSNGAFSLVGDYQINGQQAVIAGAYGYTLWKNGVSNPSDGNWYLRSQLKPVDPVNPVDPVGPGSPTDPAGPGGPVGPTWPGVPAGPATPIYQPGAPLYESMPQVALGMMGMSTLQQRVGNRFWQGAPATSGNSASGVSNGAGTGVARDGRGFWGRFDGSLSRDASGLSTTGARTNTRQWRAETGLDFLAYQGAAGALTGGVSIHYGQAFADIMSPWGQGRNQTTAYGLGATATWYGNNGFYADAQARISWLDTDLTSTTLGRMMADGVKGFGHALSLEAGQRFVIGHNLMLVPQAQLTWSGVSYDRFAGPFGARVSVSDGQSLQGRLGLALQHEQQWADASGNLRSASIYGVANLYHEFLDGTSVNVSGALLDSRPGRTWAGAGLGGTYKLNGDALSLYGEVMAATNISGNGDSHRLSGKVGVRVMW